MLPVPCGLSCPADCIALTAAHQLHFINLLVPPPIALSAYRAQPRPLPLNSGTREQPGRSPFFILREPPAVTFSFRTVFFHNLPQKKIHSL